MGKLTMYIPYTPTGDIHIPSREFQPLWDTGDTDPLRLGSISGRERTCLSPLHAAGLETLIYSSVTYTYYHMPTMLRGVKKMRDHCVYMCTRNEMCKDNHDKFVTAAGGEGNSNNLPLCSGCCCELLRCPFFSPEPFMPPSPGSVGC